MSVTSRKFGLGQAFLCGLVVSLLCIAGGTPQAKAQAPFLDLGVYGGVPPTSASPVRFSWARLTRIEPTATSAVFPFSITLPLNGLQDYSFYYAPIPPTAGSGRPGNGLLFDTSHAGIAAANGAGDPGSPGPSTLPTGPSAFLPGGKYQVEYLITPQGHGRLAGVVDYEPKPDYLEGIQVPNNPPNFGPWDIFISYLGIQGRVTISVGPSSDQRPYEGARVELLAPDATGRVLASVPTNGDGFYSFYYTSGYKEGFIPPGKYIVRVSLFGGVEEQDVVYQPNTDPNSLGYYVLGARAVADFNFPQP